MTEPAHEYTNRLIHEKSPYLLQHAHNPVDWYPWGAEAFEKAIREDKLILVSIGYATCHWCHVMERESFEDPKLAEYLNAHFVAIKVDREERPDVDKIYMDSLHALGQQGGWPLNMFITPEGKPITGGTYFPPEDRYGRKSFRGVLEVLAGAWKDDREAIYKSANSITQHLQQQSGLKSDDDWQFDWSLEEKVFETFRKAFDTEYGGFAFQQQNKFPPSMGLMLLLRYYQRTGEEDALTMVEFTLQKMLAGGIYDQIGGGLSRYSTDYQWLVPHFEKMLYDNALLVWALVETWQVTKRPIFQSAVADILTYIERDLMSPEGAFYSAEDADSEGVEGKFYVWTPAEVHDVLGEDLGKIACLYWNITDQGNFEHGTSIPHRTESEEVIAQQLDISEETLLNHLRIARRKLLAARSERIRPLRDDKILTSWNGLMISAFARAGRAFHNLKYIEMAANATNFILNHLKDDNGRLLRRYREGEARYFGYLVDYAQMAQACLDLYETTFDLNWLQTAIELTEQVHTLFYNEDGPYFETGRDAEALITRSIEGYDGVEPSGNSTMAMVLLKLSAFGINPDYEKRALTILKGFRPHLEQAGVSFGAMMWSMHRVLEGERQVVITGDSEAQETQEMLRVLREGYYPNVVTVFFTKSNASKVEKVIPVSKGRLNSEQSATGYVCVQQTCQLPVHTADALKEQLLEISQKNNEKIS